MVAKSTAVLLSGGLDSAVVLGLLRREGWTVAALFIDFGQAALEQERVASKRVAAWYGASWAEAVAGPIGARPASEVPGRNDLLIAVAASVYPTDHVAIGVHAGTPYVDCSQAHVTAWQSLLDLQYGGRRRLLAPLLLMTKPEIVRLGEMIEVPISTTWSCEAADGPCLHCPSCRDRSRFVRS